MRRWDGLLDRYMTEYEERGLCEERVKAVRRELGRFGLWLKSRRRVVKKLKRRFDL